MLVVVNDQFVFDGMGMRLVDVDDEGMVGLVVRRCVMVEVVMVMVEGKIDEVVMVVFWFGLSNKIV